MKKKHLLVNAPITNGGDYLIKRGAEILLTRMKIPFEPITVHDVRQLSSIEKYESIIASGGPAYSDRLFEEDNFGINKWIDLGVIPIHFLGCGMYGDNCLDNYIYDYRFADHTLERLKKVVAAGGSLGCRDVVTMRILKNNNLEKLFYTGCPVWYMNDKNPSAWDGSKRGKIVISDPGMTKKADKQEVRARQAIEVIQYISQKFPNKEIVFTFNNGINTKYSSKCNNMIKEYLLNHSVNFVSLEKDYKGFRIYDDAFMHIGFRVHSHLYCVGQRIPSVLIEEDIRGFGMNESLGLRHILSYDTSKTSGTAFVPNKNLLQHLDDELDNLSRENYLSKDIALQYIQCCFDNGLKQWINKVTQTSRA